MVKSFHLVLLSAILLVGCSPKVSKELGYTSGNVEDVALDTLYLKGIPEVVDSLAIVTKEYMVFGKRDKQRFGKTGQYDGCFVIRFFDSEGKNITRSSKEFSQICQKAKGYPPEIIVIEGFEKMGMSEEMVGAGPGGLTT